MRRASIVGPLLLIAIGGMFLARNVFPELPLLDYLSRYWPLLLITWGALRLLEILFWAVTSKPLPVNGISGGEWSLVIFLCVFGLSLHAARGLTTWLPRAGIEWGGLEVFGESYEYPFTGESATGPAPRVVIEAFRGSARIIGVDAGAGGNAVKVTGHSTIRAMDQAMADRTHVSSDVEIVASPSDASQVIIRPHQYGAGTGDRRVSVEMDITVPRGATVIARGRDGDFDVSGVNGAVEINANNASVRLESIGGDVRLDVTDSDIIRGVDLRGSVNVKGRGSDIDLERVAGQVTINGTYTGLVQLRELAQPWHWVGPQTEITAQALPGEMRMTLSDIRATNLTGPVRITSQTKDIDLNGFSAALDLSVNRGNVSLAPGTPTPPRMSVRVDSGDVDLALLPGARFELNAGTDRGEAINEYGAPVELDSSGRGGTLRGSTGGGAAIDISLNRGRLMVRRGGAAAVSPAPRAAQGPEKTAPQTALPAGAPPRPVEQ